MSVMEKTAPARAAVKTAVTAAEKSVAFVVAGRLEERDGELVSSLASIRYRACLPGKALAGRGWGVSLHTVLPGSDPKEAARRIDARTVVFAKSFSPENEALAAELKGRGCRIVVDVCDNHFEHPQLGPHQRALIELADAVVVATPRMGEIVTRETGCACVVAPDPFEGPLGTPRFEPDPNRRLRLAWFGHPLNLDTLTTILPSLVELARDRPCELSIVTAKLPGLEERLTRLGAASGGALEVTVIPWSLEQTWCELAACDLVLIPSLEDERKTVKSPNRLVESIRAGRFAIAHPIPSYEPFGECAWLGTDVSEGIRWALDHPDEVRRRIAEGQKAIARTHSPERAADAWQGPLSTGVKLNLGCGDKILPGYVNVDLVDGRLGNVPDVQCDVRKLDAFPDDHADEILAVHLVEHLWRWEIVDVLEEWCRVLKPGGKLVVECPNLLTACREFLADPERASGPGKEGQRTMWVFYGDPQWEDPYMCHRWGYTPESLAAVLREAGLVEVRQEPAQFKLREPRDMRIVGEKPRA